MSSKSSSARSIASQLVVLFTLAATVLLCCGFAILYVIVIRHAFAEDNEVLEDKLEAVRTDLRTAGGPAHIGEELKLAHAGERTTYWVRVIDRSGATRAETPGMSDILPASNFAGVDVEPKNFRTRGKLFALTSAIVAAGDDSFTVQVAQDRSGDESFTLRLGLLLGGLLVCGAFASALIAINVTRRGLRPLSEMTHSLERVGPTRLHERVPPEGWPRELQPLVRAFDEMLDRLEFSFTRLSQFSADLAHELRTPIANLRGESEVALTRQRSPEEYREVIESSVAECERLSSIIDNLLFLARAEASDRPVARKRFDGASAIEKITTFYETVAEERRITISGHGSGEIYADPLLFNRALTNLIDNALRYTPDDGAITITLRQSATETEVVVSDNGSGIAEEDLPRVFDRFYRGDRSRSSKGTGLGLALVKSIMEMHGGTASVESRAGRGTTATLRFPSARPDPQA